MDVIFEGALSRSWGMKDVLRAVSDVPNVPMGILRISCPGKRIQGKILVAGAQHVVGAICHGVGERDAYDALRSLMELTEGNFAFLDIGGEAPAEFDQSLFICIKRILGSLPRLPHNASDMFDQDTLLDKIFGEYSAPQPVPAPAKSREFAISIPLPRLMRSAPAAAGVTPAVKRAATAPITQWNIVEPLFDNPEANHIDHAECASMIPDFVQTTDEQRSSMNKLRALPQASGTQLPWQRAVKSPKPIKWILAALGLSIAICVIAPQLWSSSTVKPQPVSVAVTELTH